MKVCRGLSNGPQAGSGSRGFPHPGQIAVPTDGTAFTRVGDRPRTSGRMCLEWSLGDSRSVRYHEIRTSLTRTLTGSTAVSTRIDAGYHVLWVGGRITHSGCVHKKERCEDQRSSRADGISSVPDGRCSQSWSQACAPHPPRLAAKLPASVVSRYNTLSSALYPKNSPYLPHPTSVAKRS